MECHKKVLICDALRDSVPFVQFKKQEKHPWKSVTFSKVTLLHGCFPRFLNCTHGTKPRNAPHLYIYTAGFLDKSFRQIKLKTCHSLVLLATLSFK